MGDRGRLKPITNTKPCFERVAPGRASLSALTAERGQSLSLADQSPCGEPLSHRPPEAEAGAVTTLPWPGGTEQELPLCPHPATAAGPPHRPLTERRRRGQPRRARPPPTNGSCALPAPPQRLDQQHHVIPRAQSAGAALRFPGPGRPPPPREQLGAVPTMPCGAARSAPSWRRPPQLAQLAQPCRPPPPGLTPPEPRAPLGLQHERRQRGRLLGTRPLRRLLRDLRAGHRDRAGAGRALR